jgi:predicted KAP-like P-loop ATPase
MAENDVVQAERLIVFFGNVPSSALKAGLIPRLATSEWGKKVIVGLAKRPDLPTTVSKAVAAELKAGK